MSDPTIRLPPVQAEPRAETEPAAPTLPPRREDEADATLRAAAMPAPATPEPPPATQAPRRIGPPAASPRARLAETPGRFPLDQAVRVAAPPGGDALALRYRTVARLGFPAGEVLAARPDARELVVASFGLIGPGGVLPRHHTALVAAELRKRSRALHHFVDMLGGRFTGLYVQAGAKYRPASNPAAAERVLAAAAGLETPALMERAGTARDTLLYHAGHLASRSRSADRLAAMLSEEVGAPVRLEEFTGRWVRVPPPERTRLAGGGRGAGAEGQHARLGESALLGVQSWDAQARFTVRIGPVDRRIFERLLPGRPLHARLVALTRLVVGLDTGFAIAAELEAPDIVPLRLGAEPPSAELGPEPAGRAGRLGWSSWLSLPPGRLRRGPGREPLFEPRQGDGSAKAIA